MKKDITDMRGTIEFLKSIGDIVTIKEEVDPKWEKAAILKALDGGPAFFFEKTKGYPGAKTMANVFARFDRLAKIFDCKDAKELRFKCVDAIRNPIPPKEVKDAPCQEVVITKNIDVYGTIPAVSHTPRDGARVFGSANALFPPKYARGGHEISFKRMHFRGKDWGSFTASPGTHGEAILFMDHREEDVPVTINITSSPAVHMMSGAGMIHVIIPLGTDELAIAGGLEGSPIEIVKAKTQDAWSVAKAEYVIEGYLSPEKIWETEEAEKVGKEDATPFFPEWTGYLGKAWKSRKFVATAITHRKNPILYDWVADAFDGENVGSSLMEACFYELANRLVPGLCLDCVKPTSLRWAGGVIYQFKKRRPRDEGYQRNVLSLALAAQPGIRLVIGVDDDVDINNMDDVMWAIMTRANPQTGAYIFSAAGARGIAAQPLENAQVTFGTGGGLAIDATVPFLQKGRFERPSYIVNQIDLKKWLTEDQIKAIRAQQSEYARSMSARGV
ncbi:MAG: UbiD family decarboxylase [Chloroflexota bacterium]